MQAPSSDPAGVRLETARIVLRIGRESDAPALLTHLLRNRDEHRRWEPRSRPSFFTLDMQRKALALRAAEFAQGRSACFLLFDRARDDGAVIGRLNFTQIVRGVFHGAVVGYAIDHEYEGRGFMTEALGAALGWAFNALRLHRVMANYRPENVRSARVLEKLGFVREGYAHDYLFIDGQWTDHVLTSITNPDPDLVPVER